MGRGLPRAAFVVSRLDLGCLGHRVLDFCAGRQRLRGLVTRSSMSMCSSAAGIFSTQACDFLTLSLPSLPHLLENFPYLMLIKTKSECSNLPTSLLQTTSALNRKLSQLFLFDLDGFR